jgi:hypothetical protein
MACSVFLVTGTVRILWKATPRRPCWISLASAAPLTWNPSGLSLNPSQDLPISDFTFSSMLFNSIFIKDMIGSCSSIPGTSKVFWVGIFQDLSTLTDFNWIVSILKSDFIDTLKDTTCG